MFSYYSNTGKVLGVCLLVVCDKAIKSSLWSDTANPCALMCVVRDHSLCHSRAHPDCGIVLPNRSQSLICITPQFLACKNYQVTVNSIFPRDTLCPSSQRLRAKQKITFRTLFYFLNVGCFLIFYTDNIFHVLRIM